MMKELAVPLIATLLFLAGFTLAEFRLNKQYKVEIQALHTQIEKQNCEGNTIPRLRKELLRR